LSLEWRGDEDYVFSGIWYPVADDDSKGSLRHREILRLPHRHVNHRKAKPVRSPRAHSRKESEEVAGIDDSEARANFARVIGLSKVPKRQWGALKSLDGIFEKIMKYEKETDPAEIVRRVRRG